MLDKVLKAAGSFMPMATAGCVALAAYSGRKLGLAGAYKMGAAVARAFGNENATALEKTSQDYWTSAKKDAVRDLTAVGALLALGIASSCAGEAFKEKEALKEEPGYFEYYGTPVLKVTDRLSATLWDYKKTVAATVTTTAGSVAAVIYKYRRPLANKGIYLNERIYKFDLENVESNYQNWRKLLTEIAES